MKKLLLALLLSTALPASAALRSVLQTTGSSGPPPTNHTAIDGTAHSSAYTVSLTTTQSNDVIVVCYTNNGGTGPSAVTGGGLTWTEIAATSNGNLTAWYAIAPSPLSAVSIAPTITGSTFITTDIWGISGANTSSPFDGAAIVGTTSATISTTNAADFIGGCGRGNSGSPGIDTGYTAISNVNFASAEYKLLTAVAGATVGGSGLTATNTIVFAVKST